MRNLTLSIHALFLATLGTAFQLAAQEFVIDQTMPYVYIKLDHMGMRAPILEGKSTKGLWLRLVNNCRVPIPDGAHFIGVDSQLGHCAVGVYDLGTGQMLWSHPFGPCLSPPKIVMLPDGKSFITNRVDEANRENRKKKLYRYAAIYDTNTGKKIADIPETDGISAADISSDGRWLVAIIWRGTQFQIWDLQAKKIVLKGVPKGWSRTADCALNRIRFSSDNHWLIVGCNVRGGLAIYKWDEDYTAKQ